MYLFIFYSLEPRKPQSLSLATNREPPALQTHTTIATEANADNNYL